MVPLSRREFRDATRETVDPTTETSRTASRAVIFDMDGVLIDSEPLWRRAEIEIFGEAGLSLSEADCIETQGLRVDEVVAYWAERQPFRGRSHEAIALAINERVAELVRAEGKPLPGVHAAVESARRRGFRLGLASSSSRALIETVLDQFDLQGAFECIRSAENERFGKPHPAVYLSAADDLGTLPTRCIAIEDSINGVRSALAASMYCIAIPGPENRDDPRFAVAHQRLASLAALDDALEAFETDRQEERPRHVD